MSAVIAGMENVANNEGYNLIISQSSESAEKERVNAATLFNSRVDGLLVSLAYDTDSPGPLRALFQKEDPADLFRPLAADKPNAPASRSITKRQPMTPPPTSSARAVRRIVHITATPEKKCLYRPPEGIQASARRQPYPLPRRLCHRRQPQPGGRRRRRRPHPAMKPLPDAVFVANDNCAVGCMAALETCGIRIPEDIAFVGFNNDPVSTVVEPTLPPSIIPGYEMGQFGRPQPDRPSQRSIQHPFHQYYPPALGTDDPRVFRSTRNRLRHETACPFPANYSITGAAKAEDGYRLWLRYDRIDDPAAFAGISLRHPRRFDQP